VTRLRLRVPRHVLAIPLGEQLEDLTGLGMTTGGGLRIEKLTIDGNVEDTLGAGRQSEGVHDMLVLAQDVGRRAHGAVEIVSGDAVCDVDRVHGFFEAHRSLGLHGRAGTLD
jgi:hypothetical protein